MTSPGDLFPELERLGEQEVRTRLAQHVYSERKILIVKEWLRQQEEQRGRFDNSIATAQREADLKIQKSLKNATWVASIMSVIGIIISVIALATAISAKATNERASARAQDQKEQQLRAYIAKRRGDCYSIFAGEGRRVSNVMAPPEYDPDDDVCRIRYRSMKADPDCARIAAISDTLHYPLLDRRRIDCETQSFTNEF